MSFETLNRYRALEKKRYATPEKSQHQKSVITGTGVSTGWTSTPERLISNSRNTCQRLPVHAMVAFLKYYEIDSCQRL
jgi:hypothetical protein